MRLPSILLMAGLLCTLGAEQARQQQTLSERYEHKDHGYVVRYPANYEQMDGGDDATKLFAAPSEGELDVFRENLSVMVRSYDRDVPLEEARTALKKEMEARGAKLKEESDQVKLSKQAAHRVSWSLNLGGFDLVLEQLVTTVRNRVYVVTFTYEDGAEQRHRAVANAMADAFEITYK